MESAGSAVVDFGRFCTAFLVVMGIGTLISGIGVGEGVSGKGQAEVMKRHRWLTWMSCSTAGATGAYGAHCCSGDGHVDYWGAAHLWDYHKLHAFLPGGAGFLGCILGGGGALARAERMLLIYKKRMQCYPSSNLTNGRVSALVDIAVIGVSTIHQVQTGPRIDAESFGSMGCWICEARKLLSKSSCVYWARRYDSLELSLLVSNPSPW